MTSTFFNSLTMATFFSAVFNFFLAIILPVQLYLLLIGGVILLDTYFGVIKSRREKEKFSLHRMLKGIALKMCVYSPAMLGVYWLDAELLNEFVMLFINIELAVTKIGCAILVSTELTSINGNIKKITGKSLVTRVKESFKIAKDIKKETDNF